MASPSPSVEPDLGEALEVLHRVHHGPHRRRRTELLPDARCGREENRALLELRESSSTPDSKSMGCEGAGDAGTDDDNVAWAGHGRELASLTLVDPSLGKIPHFGREALGRSTRLGGTGKYPPPCSMCSLPQTGRWGSSSPWPVGESTVVFSRFLKDEAVDLIEWRRQQPGARLPLR